MLVPLVRSTSDETLSELMAAPQFSEIGDEVSTNAKLASMTLFYSAPRDT